MPRPKKIETPLRVSTVLSENQHKHLELMSIRTSYTEGTKVSMSELVRRAVETCYPLPRNNNMDLFKEEE